MTAVFISLLAETFIHPGAGMSNGPVDLPVAREEPTGYPFVAGSSMKGAWLDSAKQDQNLDAEWVSTQFGSQEAAGELLFYDARLLLLPVRSLSGSYKWLTCPYILARLRRDQTRINNAAGIPSSDLNVDRGHYLGPLPSSGVKKLILEERNFSHSQNDDGLADWRAYLKTLIEPCDGYSANGLENQLVVLNDTDFAWFAINGLPVQARNVLDENKQSKNLWYEEALPPDSLMYTMVTTRRNAASEALDTYASALQQRPYLQVGANETVGQGVFKLGLAGISQQGGAQ